MFGFKKMLETMTMREIRTILENKKSGWHRLMADTRAVTTYAQHEPLQFIREALEKFKPFKSTLYHH